MVVSLVLPCYNPPVGWDRVIQDNYTTFCAAVRVPVSLILVMDGCADSDTADQLAALQANIAGLHVVKYDENRGKGYAIRQGVAAAQGDIIIYTDVDFPYTPNSICRVFDVLYNASCDVAVGVKDETYYAHVPFLRRFISRYLRLLIRLFLSMPVTDTQCGLKGFKASVKPLFLKTTIDRYLFDLEFIRNCFRGKKFKVLAIPVTLNENVQFRSMNYRILLPEMFNFIKLLLNKDADE